MPQHSQKISDQNLLDYVKSVEKLIKDLTSLHTAIQAIRELPGDEYKKLKGSDVKKLLVRAFVHNFEILDQDIVNISANKAQTVHQEILMVAAGRVGHRKIDIDNADAMEAFFLSLNEKRPGFEKALSSFDDAAQLLSKLVASVETQGREAGKMSQLPPNELMRDTIVQARNVIVHLVTMNNIDPNIFPHRVGNLLETIKVEIAATKPVIGDTAGSLPGV